MKVSAMFAAFALATSAATVNAARSFNLKLEVVRCEGVVDLDPGSEDRGGHSDPVVSIQVNGQERARRSGAEGGPNPNFSWTTNAIDSVPLGAQIKVRLQDYDFYVGSRYQDMGSSVINLPNNAASWSTTEFGYRSKMGSKRWVPITGFGGTGRCYLSVQYYAAQCNPGEYVNVQGFCKSCNSGTFCANGVTQANCASGSAAATTGLASCPLCSEGKYQPGRGQTSCLPCPDGEYSSTKGATKCSACSAGRYGSGAQLRTTNQCTGPCAKGHFCPAGSPSSQQNKCGGANKYCPEGSSTPKVVDSGFYTTGGDVETRDGQKACEAGHFCIGGSKTECPESTYAVGTKNSQCTACSSRQCTAGNYRKGCGGDSEGSCDLCEIQTKDQCKNGEADLCDGNSLVDVSQCQECKCENEFNWKKLRVGQCAECIPCTHTEANCNSGNYLVDACTSDSTTLRDSDCKACKDFCQPGEFYNSDCGGKTGPSCTACKTDCDMCEAKAQGDCATPNCLWDGQNCRAHPITGKFVVPGTRCDGKTDSDSTQCSECSGVDVPADHYLFDCQASGNARFKPVTKCILGSSWEKTAPTRTSDRVCEQCAPCKDGEYEAVACSATETNLCVAVSEPRPGYWVLQIATKVSNTKILPVQDCSILGKWEDLSVPYVPGSSTQIGQDKTCVDYNECNFKFKYIARDKNATSDYTCGDLTMCSDVSREKGKPAFQAVKETTTTDRVCALCSEWNNDRSRFETNPNYNETVAAAEYKFSCIDLVDTSMTTGAKVAIASVGVLALLSMAGVAFVVRRKRQLAHQKDLTEKEVDKAKDDLELNESMVRNPLQGPDPSEVDTQSLISANSLKDAEILKLREEIRRLKMVLQKDSNAGSFKRVELSARNLHKKKQFGQSGV